jgi:hypothetical protein
MPNQKVTFPTTASRSLPDRSGDRPSPDQDTTLAGLSAILPVAKAFAVLAKRMAGPAGRRMAGKASSVIKKLLNPRVSGPMLGAGALGTVYEKSDPDFRILKDFLGIGRQKRSDVTEPSTNGMTLDDMILTDSQIQELVDGQDELSPTDPNLSRSGEAILSPIADGEAVTVPAVSQTAEEFKLESERQARKFLVGLYERGGLDQPSRAQPLLDQLSYEDKEVRANFEQGKKRDRELRSHRQAMVEAMRAARVDPRSIDLSRSPAEWTSNLLRDILGWATLSPGKRRMEKIGQRQRIAGAQTRENLAELGADPELRKLIEELITTGASQGDITARDLQTASTIRGEGAAERARKAAETIFNATSLSDQQMQMIADRF